MKGETYTAERRIKVNSPKLLLSETGATQSTEMMVVCEFGKRRRGRRGKTLHLLREEKVIHRSGVRASLGTRFDVARALSSFQQAEVTQEIHGLGCL